MGAISAFFMLAKANPLGAFMRLLPWLILLAAIGYGLYSAYSWAYDNGVADERLKWVSAESKALKDAVAEVDRLNRKNRQLEADYQAQDQAMSAKYQLEIQNVEKNAKRVIAELRADNIRLRDPYADSIGRAAESRASEAGSTPGGCISETGGELSKETSEFLIDLAAEADEVVEQLTYTQRLLIECRKRSGALDPIIQ